MLVFEEEWEVFGYKVQSPLRGYLGEGVREFLDLSLQDIQNLVKESPEGGVVFSLVVHLLNLFLGLSQRYGFPGVLPNITKLERPPPYQGWGIPVAPSGVFPSLPLIYSGRSRILHLQEFFFRLETTYCVSGTGCVVLGKTLLEIRRGIPPGASTPPGLRLSPAVPKRSTSGGTPSVP